MLDSMWRSMSLRAARILAVVAVVVVALGVGAPAARAANQACVDQCNTDHSACNARCMLLTGFPAIFACTQHCTTVFFSCVNACPA
jgi:hypothetical protein